ncbi:MAG TPA: carbamoyl phosphate synthase small subunit [Oscillospiraceae bacterium]|nr:carbamoyl phosphate synthase small subunit [Oscillospiraceae bacterium]HPS34487.1 carbamoyl phosphate synthase small subunit [Oscillospiraceae bacterium]
MGKRFLVLDDGTTFEGIGFGADTGCTGELVFTTGMCGYIETLTDPSYYGQIVLQTFPLIGNYGIIEADFEGKCCVKGYVVHEWCDTPSNFRAQYDLDAFLKKSGIPGIYGLDTREITKIIREHGVMNAMICDEVPKDLTGAKNYLIVDAVKSVTCEKIEEFPAQGETKYKVALADYGAKHNIIRELRKRGCAVTVVPSYTTAKEILALKPDGVMLSNGPGDPAENTEIIKELGNLFGKVPIFGICLGHQLLALSQGGKTMKLKYGHRGVNQPVRDLLGTRTYITSQNHGYAVVSDTVKNGVISFENANDGTCEGVDYTDAKAFTVQFHPEASSGPLDTAFLFDRFCALMDSNCHSERSRRISD